MVFMQSYHSTSSQVSQLNHPRLTNLIYKNVSQPSDTLSYNGRALTRGTRGFIEYAQLRFLPSSTNQSQTLNLANKKLSLLESVAKDVRLHLIKFLNPISRAKFFQTTRFFHDLKEASLKERSDLISKLIKHVNGDLSVLNPQDHELLQAIGPSIISLNLSNIPLTPEKLEKIIRIFPCIQELEFNNCEITDVCLEELKPLNDLSALHLKKLDLRGNALSVISEITNLKKLSIDAAIITDEGLRFLGNLSQLEFLSLSVKVIHLPIMMTLQGFGEKLKSLQALHLNGLRFEQGALLSLSHFTNLRDLTLTSVGDICDPVFQEIGKLTKLRVLKIRSEVTDSTDKALEHLSKLTGLEMLDFRPPCRCSKGSFENFLKSFPHLTDLCIVTSPTFLGDAELFEVIASSCQSLKRLSFHFFHGVGEEFHQLAALPELERIEFESADARLKSIIFENLDQFPKLKKLVISDCQSITSNDVESARASQKKMPEIEFIPYSSDSESEDSEEED